MKDRDIFQDDLHTADKIEAARQARERQINKGIMTNPISSISSDVEKAVQSQALSEDANGGDTSLLFPEVKEYKQQLDESNVTETWIDLQLRNIQKQMIYKPNDATLSQMRDVLLEKKEELKNGEKKTLQGISAAKKAKSLILSPEDITNGSKARDKAVDTISATLKEEFGELQVNLNDGVHRDGGILIYKNVNIVWDKTVLSNLPNNTECMYFSGSVPQMLFYG